MSCGISFSQITKGQDKNRDEEDFRSAGDDLGGNQQPGGA
jgi:hypothetical protein